MPLIDRKLNMHHELVRELAVRKRRALCIVTGVIQTTRASCIKAQLHHGRAAAAEVDVSEYITTCTSITDI